MPGAAWSLILLLAINLFNYIDRYILAAVVPGIEKRFFAPDDPNAKFWVGTLATAFLVSYTLTAPVFGWLGDRARRWLLICIGVVVWSLASGASGIATTFAMLFITRAFVGIGEGAYGPIAPAMISDMYPIEKRTRVISIFYLAIPVGSALGFVIGGALSAAGKKAGMEDTESWRIPFWAVVLPGLALGALCLFRPEVPRTGGTPAAPPRRIRLRDYAVLLRTPSYVLNTIAYTASTFALGGVSYWIVSYVSGFRKAGEEASVTMWFGAITVVSGLGATMLGGWLADYLRPRVRGAHFIVCGGAMLIGFPFFLGVLWAPFPLAWVFAFVAVFCLFINIGPTNAILANVTHPAMRSAAFALTIFVIHILGDVISPPLIGFITGRANGNMNAGFFVVSGAILVAAIVWLAGVPFLERDVAAAPNRLPPGD